MLTNTDLDRIRELANTVKDKLQDLETETLTGLLDAVLFVAYCFIGNLEVLL